MVSLIITLANSIYIKEISDTGEKKTKIVKQSISLLILSTKLTTLNSLIKFHNQ